VIKKVQNAPNQPGVYTFIDKKGTIIYVGKAVSLIKRLKSYFDSSFKQPKTLKMLELVVDLKYYVTNTETEALLLEASLIKTEKPRFNVKLKDAKGYPYIKITRESYPKLIVTRNTDDKEATYYGPYVNVRDLRYIVRDLHYIFPLRRCKNSKFKEGRVCIYYQMKQCEGPCEGIITQEEYMKIVEDVKLFFNGHVDELENKYNMLMKDYAANLKFEKAALYRDRLKSLKNIFAKQSTVVNFAKNTDIFYFNYKDIFSVTKMFVRNGNITGIDSECFGGDELLSCSEIVLNFYKNTGQIPDSISLLEYNDDFSEDMVAEAVSELKGKKVELRKKIPAGMIEILKKNSELAVKQFLESELGIDKIKSAFNKIVGEKEVKSIECIDISHIYGDFTVGASVCFDFNEQRFDKSRYRRYKIRGIANNDFESIYQVIKRKGEKIVAGEEEKSDLYIIDGGLGQLKAATKGFEEYNIAASVVAIAKGRSKSFDEKIESDISPEYIFIHNRKNPLNFKKNDPFLLFVQKIRDEAHRFVIEYARKSALNNIKKSNLTNFKGIGEKRAKKLLIEYPDIKNILSADLKEVSKKTGVPENILQNLIQELKGNRFL
jgi:excinuclease ABC subunit C